MNTVLAILANPKGSNLLRLSEEIRVIEDCFRLSARRNYILKVCQAATVDHARRALLDTPCEVVHFGGHGTPHGLVLEDQRGFPQPVRAEALAEWLSRYVPPVQTVLLNVCYSGRYSEMLARLRIPWIIASPGELKDRPAIEFAKGFYDALAADRGVQFAFREGCSAIQLIQPADDLPTLTESRWPRSEVRSAEPPRPSQTTQPVRHSAPLKESAPRWSIKCRICRGGGTIGFFNRSACPACGGAGKLNMVGSASEYVRCKVCFGFGMRGLLDYFDRIACRSCRGSGLQHL
jgi:hypothetical protein